VEQKKRLVLSLYLLEIACPAVEAACSNFRVCIVDQGLSGYTAVVMIILHNPELEDYAEASVSESRTTQCSPEHYASVKV